MHKKWLSQDMRNETNATTERSAMLQNNIGSKTLINLIEFPITEREEAFQVSFAYLTDKIEVSSFGSGRNPARRTTISNAQYSKLSYLASQITSSMQKVGKGTHYFFARS